LFRLFYQCFAVHPSVPNPPPCQILEHNGAWKSKNLLTPFDKSLFIFRRLRPSVSVIMIVVLVHCTSWMPHLENWLSWSWTMNALQNWPFVFHVCNLHWSNYYWIRNGIIYRFAVCY